jgi:membrane protease YdiL (CAAX protease family)
MEEGKYFMKNDYATVSEDQIEQLGLVKSFVLHLAPGLIALIIFVTAAPLFEKSGLPSFFALFLGLIISFLLMLLFMMYKGKLKTGNASIKSVIFNREKVKPSQYLIIVPILILWSLVIGGIFTPINDTIIDKFFSWLPDWFWWTKQFEHLESLSMPVLITLFFILLIGNAFLGPIIEEIYFRGYLLPRMSRFGKAAPLLSVILFSIYHFFSPEQSEARLLTLTPIVYAVWWKRDIKISIITHCIINLMPSILVFTAIINKARFYI